MNTRPTTPRCAPELAHRLRMAAAVLTRAACLVAADGRLRGDARARDFAMSGLLRAAGRELYPAPGRSRPRHRAADTEPSVAWAWAFALIPQEPADREPTPADLVRAAAKLREWARRESAGAGEASPRDAGVSARDGMAAVREEGRILPEGDGALGESDAPLGESDAPLGEDDGTLQEGAGTLREGSRPRRMDRRVLRDAGRAVWMDGRVTRERMLTARAGRTDGGPAGRDRSPSGPAGGGVNGVEPDPSDGGAEEGETRGRACRGSADGEGEMAGRELAGGEGFPVCREGGVKEDFLPRGEGGAPSAGPPGERSLPGLAGGADVSPDTVAIFGEGADVSGDETSGSADTHADPATTPSNTVRTCSDAMLRDSIRQLARSGDWPRRLRLLVAEKRRREAKRRGKERR